jgi:hypothetical protein
LLPSDKKKVSQNERGQTFESLTNGNDSKKIVTLTILLAAMSDGYPREHSRAISKLKSSHTPSLAIIILPPAFESCNKKFNRKSK